MSEFPSFDPPRLIPPSSTPEWDRASAEARRTILLLESLGETLDEHDVIPPPLLPMDPT